MTTLLVLLIAVGYGLACVGAGVAVAYWFGERDGIGTNRDRDCADDSNDGD